MRPSAPGEGAGPAPQHPRVDDQAVVREGLRAVLAAAPDVVVVGDAPDGETASTSSGGDAPTWC